MLCRCQVCGAPFNHIYGDDGLRGHFMAAHRMEYLLALDLCTEVVVSLNVFATIQEEKPDKRPKCGWKITEKLADGGTTRKECGSEERVFNVSGQGRITGRSRETPICEKHLKDAWKEWNVDSAQPIDYVSGKSQE